MKTAYSTLVTLQGGRLGTVRSADGNLALSLAMPTELGGPGGPGTNPEQLFAAGFAACFESSVRYAAQLRQVALASSRIDATAGILLDDGGGFHLSLSLKVHLPGIEPSLAAELIEAASGICPYAKAVRGNVNVAYDTVTA